MATDCSEEAKQYDSDSVQKTMAFDNDRNQLRPHSPVTSRPSRRTSSEPHTIKSSARTPPLFSLNILGRIL